MLPTVPMLPTVRMSFFISPIELKAESINEKHATDRADTTDRADATDRADVMFLSFRLNLKLKTSTKSMLPTVPILPIVPMLPTVPMSFFIFPTEMKAVDINEKHARIIRNFIM